MRTGADGAFTFAGLPAADVVLEVEREDGARAELTLAPDAAGRFTAPTLVLRSAPLRRTQGYGAALTRTRAPRASTGSSR